MGAGAIFILLVVIVVIAVAVFAVFGGGWFGRDRTASPEGSGRSGERPRHTKATIEQNERDEKRGEPVDRIT